jgi:hypothetical protein
MRKWLLPPKNTLIGCITFEKYPIIADYPFPARSSPFFVYQASNGNIYLRNEIKRNRDIVVVAIKHDNSCFSSPLFYKFKISVK